MQECPGCGAQLIVHMDGRVEYQGATEAPPEEEAEKSKQGIGEFHPEDVMREIDFDMDEKPVAVDPVEANEATQMRTLARPSDAIDPSDDLAPPPETFESEKEFLGAADLSAEEVGAPIEPPPESNEFMDMDIGGAPAPEAVYNSGGPVSSSPDLGDVASFGNSEQSGGREGPLRYNLFIEGIDTVDVREAFREAITDRKLMWDTDQILRSVRNGRVNIPNVAPTKAYILITRLRGMPVQVRWEQYAISQT